MVLFLNFKNSLFEICIFLFLYVIFAPQLWGLVHLARVSRLYREGYGSNAEFTSL